MMVNRLKFLNSLVADIVLLFCVTINHFNCFMVEVAADIGFYGLFIVMVNRLKFLNSLVADIILLFF